MAGIIKKSYIYLWGVKTGSSITDSKFQSIFHLLLNVIRIFVFDKNGNFIYALIYAQQCPVNQRQALIGGLYLLKRKIVQSYEGIDLQKLWVFVDKISIHEPRGCDDPTISHRKGI